MANPKTQTETIVITNFGGRLTRMVNGELNSGFAKFKTSFGYDPFSKPMNLTWLEQPTSVLSSSTNIVLAAKERFQVGDSAPMVYAVNATNGGNNASLIAITPNSVSNANVDTTSVLGVISNNTPAFSFGSSIDFFGDTEKVYVSSDGQINSINFDGSGDTKVGTTGYKASQFRPLKQFVGKLHFGNGNTIAAIDSTGTITSSIIGTGQGNLYSELNPPLPVENTVHDIDASPDGNYLLITAADQSNENIGAVLGEMNNTSATFGFLYGWNGSDAAVTTANQIPSFAITALQTYLQKNLFFGADAFGAILSDGTTKILTLENNKSPLPNATMVNGNFLCWANPEITGDGTTMQGSMYYFGSLDEENPKGLYRLMRLPSTLSNGFIYQIPLNILVNSKYTSLNQAKTALVKTGYGKHYFSVWDLNATTNAYKLFRFLVTSTGTGTPQAGVYETQTQLFSKRIGVSQIRVYTEPTVAGNAFQLDVIGADGSIVPDGTYTYTFGDTIDPQSGSTSLERINFNPNAKTQYALGLRITNTGTTNMTIKKIEVDYTLEGK